MTDEYASQSQEYNPNNERAFNQLTSHKYDVCEYSNSLRISSKPMKYYVNQYNSPQSNSFSEFTSIGNQQVWNVQNEYDHPLPTRLNELPQVYVLPYNTTPNLGLVAPSMQYSDTASNLRISQDVRPKKSVVGLAEIDYAQFNPGVDANTVQNAGGNGGAFQNNAQGIDRDGFYDYRVSNNVLWMNSSTPLGGLSSRNEMHNSMDTRGC
jgi:hypothetical protein